ncbi:hypothetical protein Pst134EA_021279 [Puccinia striiformis f. sp. tritici]|uniref:hypothetical protein n=1 Tax=Puccinia striiformis f. sp. tritici TaxID=168172 RepID=UPI0020088D4D|nr:hypothetical protein Pst134EA_021279 [Puccinia striiformis f. sp. tritici]KAH9457403.1 hypothetical protein Pst134EA_021279 [Puccinia striiformis f. sp. tritici]KAI9617715.1 hypothetical protein H4Q26_013023 [Puccinia striiformis f. sp. tritici PST-130]
MLTQASEQAPQSEKRRRTGKDTTSHGPTLETVLVDIDLVIFGEYEIQAWFPSPYVIDQLEYRQATSAVPTQHSADERTPLTTTKTTVLKRNHNGRFRKKKTNKKKINNHVFSTQDTSTPPLLDPVDSNAQQNKKRHRSSDSLSSIDSNSSTPPQNASLPTLTTPLPVPPHHLYPTSHSSSLTSDPLTVDPIKPLPPSSSSSSHPTTLPPPPPPAAAALKLYVCDGCLRYLFSSEAYLKHKIRCRVSHPPGRKVYQSGEIIIREIDGSKEKLYCQCLCLFGKLFIDHKYIFFDVEGFKFYVLTIAGNDQPPKPTEEEEESNGKREKIVGFFSKEKISYDGYNLACIVTLPPYQKRGYGSLLIEFSYELDRYEAEKIKANDQDQIPTKVLLGTPERPLSVMGARGYLHFWTAVLVRFFRTLFTPPAPRLEQSGNQQTQVIEITLDEISRSTRIRPDDVAFSLISSGLTCHTHAPDQTTPSSTSSQNNPSPDDDSCIQSFLITSELVETVARKMKVKKAILDPRHILLNSPQNVDHDDLNEVDRSDEINDRFIHSDHSCILHLPSSPDPDPDPGLDSSASSNPPRISYFGNHHNHNHTSS